jgi:hypothetical protein
MTTLITGINKIIRSEPFLCVIQFCHATLERFLKFDTTAAEMQANRSKRDAAKAGNVAEFGIGIGNPIVADTSLGADCAVIPDGSEVIRCACHPDRCGRTPRIGDEAAVIGFDGMVWWYGRNSAMQSPLARGKSAKTQKPYKKTKTNVHCRDILCY